MQIESDKVIISNFLNWLYENEIISFEQEEILYKRYFNENEGEN